MRAFIFMFLYGSLFIIGVFLSVFWTNVTLARSRVIDDRWSKYTDRHVILAAGVAFSALGVAIHSGGRIFGNLAFGLSPILQSKDATVIGLGLFMLLCGSLIMVWLADLETQPPMWRWLKTVAVLSIMWALAALALAPTVPFYPADLAPPPAPILRNVL